MFSRVGAGQSVNFMILDRAPDVIHQPSGNLFESIDFDQIVEADED